MSTVSISEKTSAFLAPLGLPQNLIQREVYDRLCEMEFPTTRDEYWKYTRVNKLVNAGFKRAQAGLLKDSDLQGILPENNFVIIDNGSVRQDISRFSIPGIAVRSVREGEVATLPKPGSALDLGQIFSALNAAYYDEVILITISTKVEMTVPLNLIFSTSGDGMLSSVKVVVVVEKSASAKLAVTFASNGSNSFTNYTGEYFVGENAHLQMDKVQRENETSFHVSTEQVNQQASSFFQLNTVTLDGSIVRNNLNITVDGENCESHMNGAIILKGSSHVDNHTFVDHKVANCFSNENYKYVLDDKSTGVFNGKVVVRQHAQKINAYQKNSNILLSDFARIDSKPELEIYADDVKCSHGSTTGQLDEDAVFYLQARGVSKHKAKKMLVQAFIGEITDNLKSDWLKEQVASVLVTEQGWTDVQLTQ